MKLHVSFVVDALRADFPMLRHGFGPSSNWHTKVGYPHVFRPDGTPAAFSNGDLVLAHAQELPPDAAGFHGCSLICLGNAPDAYKQGACDYVELPPDAEETAVLERLITTNEMLESWRERVVAAMVHAANLAEIYDLYLELFENPVFFTDEVHDMVVYAEDSERVDEPDVYHFISRDLSETEIRENLMQGVLVSPRYESTFKTEGPQLWSDDDAPFDSLYCNIFIDGAYRGRILLDERVRHFRISDYALVQMLHDDMLALISSRSWLESDFKTDAWQHILNILDGERPNPEKLDLIMRDADWRGRSRFACLVAHLEERDKTIGSGFVNSRLIEKAVPNSRALLHEDHIVVIAPLEEGMTVRGLFTQELALVIRDNLMKVGVSNEFSELEDIKMRYEQAKLALEVGRLLGKTDWVLFCDDCLLPYMLDHSHGALTHQALCHSKLQALIDYDAEHDLDYVKTLQGFLENNCSQADTCRALFLHRSTLIQRLRRIEEITKFDLDDKDTRLYLLMFFASLEQRAVTVG